MSKYTPMWEYLRDQLIDLSYAKYEHIPPPISLHLLVAILIQAGKDADYSYLDSVVYLERCEILKLHPKFVRKLVVRCMDNVLLDRQFLVPREDDEELDSWGA